jgi:deoxyribodipyrimidine photolyase-related protein
MKTFLIYPHQLFERTEHLRHYEIILIEEPLFFTQYSFHVQKPILHRASMKRYEQKLLNSGFYVRYIQEEEALAFYEGGGDVSCYDVADDWLEKKIRRSFARVSILKSPNFLNHDDDSLFLHTFYARRRKALGIWLKMGNLWAENGVLMHRIESGSLKRYSNLPF